MMKSSYPIPFHDREEGKRDPGLQATFWKVTPIPAGRVSVGGCWGWNRWSIGPSHHWCTGASYILKLKLFCGNLETVCLALPPPEEALRDLEMRHYEREGLERNEGAKKKKKKKKKTKKKNAGGLCVTCRWFVCNLQVACV